jgi:hypothetical protein
MVFETKIERGEIIMVKKSKLSGDRINLIILAVRKEKTREGEDFSHFIKRVREKYANKLGTDNISLMVVGDSR